MEAEEEGDFAVVLDLVGRTELALELLEVGEGVGDEELVVNVEGDEDDVALALAAVDAGVGGGGDEAMLLEPGVNFGVPLARSLVDAIEGAEESDDPVARDAAALGSL